jgi:Fe2+ transport system protein FeoA
MRRLKGDVVPLDRLEPGQAGRVVRVDLPEEAAVKLAEMGLAAGRKVRFLRRAPAGDPIEIGLIHYRLALRNREARGILLRRDAPPPGRPVRGE